MTLETFVRYLEANDRFHRELWRLAKSQVLTRMIESAITLPFAAPGALLFGHMESAEGASIGPIALEHHRSMIEAIQHREGTRAGNLAREHSRMARRNLERALRSSLCLRRLESPKGRRAAAVQRRVVPLTQNTSEFCLR
jgi:GntR family transcriptional regulator of vanillate catabolism